MGSVLVIGNEPLADALRHDTRLAGREVVGCENAVESIGLVGRRAVDVVVTNPVTSIHEDLALASELRARRPGVKVIALAPATPTGALIAALQAQVFACFTAPFEESDVVDMVRSALTAIDWHDDIEVLSGADTWITLRVSCQLLTAERLVRFMTELQSGLPDGEHNMLMIAFREMLINSMEHGGGFDPKQTIEVTAARTARAIVYHFRDPGPGFDRADLGHTVKSSDPEDLMSTTVARAEMGKRPGGLGILIARQIVDEIAYNERGNEAILIKHLS